MSSFRSQLTRKSAAGLIKLLAVAIGAFVLSSTVFVNAVEDEAFADGAAVFFPTGPMR